MGAYRYVTKPSHTAEARVRYQDGREATIDIALYRYAFKPSHAWGSGETFNARMDFKTGVVACERAYANSDRKVPQYGVCFDAETKRLYADTRRPFLTKGLVSGEDDYDFAKYADEFEIVEWVKLPKGISAPPVRP